jgi:tetratricopeptide (TPR) repeat protein
MTSCPSDETLAVFVERKLDGAERDEVIAHLAECADCRDIVLMATDIATEDDSSGVTEDGPSKVVRPKFGNGKVLMLAAAAAIVVIFALSSFQKPLSGGDDVRVSHRMFKERQTAGRLSFYEEHKQFRRTRGGDVAALRSAELAAQKAKQRAATEPTAERLHNLGLAQLLIGRRREAVDALTRASRLEDSPEVLNDLSAAYIEAGEYDRAAQVADGVLKKRPSDPAAAWNRALALEYLTTRDREAIAAWSYYIGLESDDKWKGEAQEHLDTLTEQRGMTSGTLRR